MTAIGILATSGAARHVTLGAVLVVSAAVLSLRLLGMFVLPSEVSPRVQAMLGLIPVCVITAVVVQQSVTVGTHLRADARLVGVGVAAVAAWRRAPMWVVVVTAAVVTAVARRLGLT